MANGVTTVDIPSYGKLSMTSNPQDPLLVVFGGIPVGGVQSGVYMWNYMNAVKSRFQIFVAVNSNVNGTQSFSALKSTLQTKGLAPTQQILYLFSGGWRAGIDVLTSEKPAAFSSIYLVDIWMGIGKESGSRSPDFYKALVSTDAAKITYVYTSFGANNPAVRDYIAGQVGQRATLVQGQRGEEGMQTHMRTNAVAVGNL